MAGSKSVGRRGWIFAAGASLLLGLTVPTGAQAAQPGGGVNPVPPVAPAADSRVVPSGASAGPAADVGKPATTVPTPAPTAPSWLPQTPGGWSLVVDKTDTRPATITRGVSEQGETIDTVSGRQQSHILTVNLADQNVRVGIQQATDHIIAPRDETTSSMANRTGAVAGVNGDYFDINATGAPLNGLIRDGRLFKSPRPGSDALLAIHRDGTASIGAETYTGSVADGPASHSITSVNTLADAAAGGITHLTADLGPVVSIPAAVLVTGHRSGTTLVVATVQPLVTTIPQLAAGDEALLAGGAGGGWLTSTVHPGDGLAIHESIGPDTDITGLIGGATTLIKDGKGYDDPTGGPPGGVNPETAVGVSKDGRTLLLITIDGRMGQSTATGVSPAQATGYLLAHGAYSGLLLDGGGSTTMVERQPGDRTNTVRNTPSDGSERPVADGIFVYSTEKTPGPPRRVVVNHGEPVTTVVGGSLPLSAYALDSRDNPATGSVSVQISPASLASYAGGVLTARRAGIGEILARDGGATTVIPLKITATLSTLTISPTAPDVAAGGTQQFSLAGTAPGFRLKPGGTAVIPGNAAHWSSAPATLGSVNAAGLFTASATTSGLATVTATVGGKTATASVAVGSLDVHLSATADIANWTLNNTTGRPAVFGNAPGVVPPGSHDSGSVQLQYSMPGNAGVKQLVLTPTKPLPVASQQNGQNPTAFGFWVKGDGSGIDTAVRLVGADGGKSTIYTNVTWTGWRLETVQIPAGMQFPVTVGFFDFLGINPPSDLSGTLNLGGIEALYSPRPVTRPAYTAIPKNPNWLRFTEDTAKFGGSGNTLLLGDDAHLLAADPASAASNVLTQVAADIPQLPRNARPTLIQALGDMSDDGKLPDLHYAQQKLASLGLPYRDLVGNHEITQGGDPETGNFHTVFGDTHYSYQFGGANVIALDSAHGGLLKSDALQSPAGTEQFNWLVSSLTASRSPIQLVDTHMPAYDPHAAADSQFSDRWEAREYVRLLQRYQQTHPRQHVVMIYGHARGFADQMINPDGLPADAASGGIPQLTFADLGMPAYARADQGGFAHFGLLRARTDGVVQFAVQPVLTSMTVSAAKPTLAVDDQETLTATGTNPSGDNLPAVTLPIADPVSHVWSTSQPGVVSVNPVTGGIIAHTAGIAVISVRAGGLTAAVAITVG